MASSDASGVLPGWTGGYPQQHPKLDGIPFNHNNAYVHLIQRQLAARWPEFSWLTQPDGSDPEASRCFQMFAPYISRLGYSNAGRSYAIICPQQGVWIGDEVCLNVEVTVEVQRGWMDEPSKSMNVELSVAPRVWLTLNPAASSAWKGAWSLLNSLPIHLPTEKKRALVLQTSAPGDPSDPYITLTPGVSGRFKPPAFADHSDEAWTVGHLGVQIGPVIQTGHAVVDAFNDALMDAFNVASGHMLSNGNVLSWNVWFTDPNYACTAEWEGHAERWRRSIDAHHGSPDGPSSQVRDRDGHVITVEETVIEGVLRDLEAAVKDVLKHWHL